jgi:hypothetical protein
MEGDVVMIDAKELERMRRQSIIDQCWERKLLERELKRERDAARSFNKAPGDPDWELEK